MKKTLFFLLLIYFTGNCFSQNYPEKADELSGIYPESDIYITENYVELFIEYNRSNKKVIAIEKEKTDLISLNSDVNEVFIKNYNKKSSFIEYAKFESPRNYKCKIYNSNYSSNNIFHDDEMLKVIDIYLKQRGEFISFITKKRFLDLKYLDPIYLSNPDPTGKKSIRVLVDKDLKHDILKFNFDGFYIEKKEYFDDKEDVYVYEYKLNNPPYISDKDGLRGLSHYFPHILIIPKEYNTKKYSQKYFSDVSDMYKWYSSLIDSVKNDDTELKTFLGGFIDDKDSDIEKIKKIYYWVQNNIRYIAFEDGIAGFKPEAAQTVLKKKYGDCKGVANLTKELLKLEGFDARLAWIGTNSRVYDYSVPSLLVDNHMICALFYRDSIYYLDGTERFMSLENIAERIQNKEALIEDGDNFIIKTVPSQNVDNNIKKRTTQFHINNQAITGKTTLKYKGESKSSIKYFLSTVETDKKEKALKTYFDSENFEIKNVTNSNIKDFDSDFTLSFDFNKKNSVVSFDDELYIKFENFYDMQNAKIDSTFIFDYDMGYKKGLESNCLFSIPEGYEISFLPENINVKNNDFTIDISFLKKGTELIYSKNIIIKHGIIHQKNIKEWNACIKKLKEFYNSNIILKKS